MAPTLDPQTRIRPKSCGAHWTELTLLSCLVYSDILVHWPLSLLPDDNTPVVRAEIGNIIIIDPQLEIVNPRAEDRYGQGYWFLASQG